jgi:splicing factor 3B subunit 4
MSSAKHWEQDKDATLYVGNLDERAREELIFELFSQVGRVATVHAPLDRVSRTHQGYAFVEFNNAEDADYAAKVMNGIKLYGRPLKVNKSNADKEKQADIGAELFIGNLDPLVDEKMLYDTFSRFGTLVSNPKVFQTAHELQATILTGHRFLEMKPTSRRATALFPTTVSSHRTRQSRLCMAIIS